MSRLLGIFFLWAVVRLTLTAQGGLQAYPAKLKCVSVVNSAGDIVINWVPPPDPLNQFYAYEIFQSNSNIGPYLLINTIYNLATSSFTHTGAGGNTQSRYYFIRTRWGPNGLTSSAISDTLHSIFLSITGIGGGVAHLNYNDIHTSHLATSYPKFDIYKSTTGILPFSYFRSTSQTKHNDTVKAGCTGMNYYYYIELKDSSGCSSVSNIANGSFVDNLPPVVPTLDSASVLANGQTVLGWVPSPSSDVAGYIIYQVVGGINVPVDTIWGVHNTSYTYTSTAANTGTVQFVVSAIDSCNNVSILSGSQTTIFLKSHYNVCAHSINLQWDGFSFSGGGTTYYIYLSENGGAYNLKDSTNSLSYLYDQLDYNRNYCIFVRAKSKSGITTSSNRACFTAYGPSVPSVVYIRYATVKDTSAVLLAFYVDSSKTSTGIELLRSTDNMNYQSVTIIPTSTNSTVYFYTDHSVFLNTLKQSYYYKAYILDSCGNRRNPSNISKTILLRVRKDHTRSFTALLDWSDYQNWPAGVSDYYIYRKVDNVLETNPRAIVPASIRSYSDDYSDLYAHSGKIGYIVIAAENAGNPYGFIESSSSNTAYLLDEGAVFIPNAFAPDGVNSEWKPVFQFPNPEDYHLWIYDKWGRVIFSTNDINRSWDGGDYPQDVYAYFIRYKNSRGEYLELKGSITLLR